MRSSRRGTAALAIAAASGLVLTLGSTAPAVAKNPNNSAKMTKSVTVQAVHDHLEAFQSIADAHDGNRASGTPGYEASAEYVEQQLHAAGYETQRQPFTFLYQETQKQSLTEVSPTDRDIDNIVMSYSPNTPEGGVTAELVQPAAVEGCDAAAWDGVDADGKIALVSRGTCSFADKSLYAGQAGAEAAIIYNNDTGDLNGTLGGQDDAFVPTTGVQRAAGQSLVDEMAAGPVTVNLDLQQIAEERETFNVIAETAEGRDDNVVMLGAHLDSVPDGPGINDNGSGSAAILETAIQLAKVNKLNNKVRFAWWGAEELGLVGSTHYVNDLVENDPGELDDIATYLNFDMVASPNHIIGVYDADESTYPAPVEVPEGSEATEDVLTDYFDDTDQAWVDTEFSGRSDYQAFIVNGVPASGLFTGADGTKTPEEVEMFGGTAGITYDPNYHSPADDISNINMTALDIMSDAIAHATITLAYDTSAINDKCSAGKSGHPKPCKPKKPGKVTAPAPEGMEAA
ncbi:MAG: M20/M25/M40 family metallo-hydrolase [Nocardioidaceae bacterium]